MTTENTPTADDANTLTLGPIVMRKGRFGLSVHLVDGDREITHARTGDPLRDLWKAFKGVDNTTKIIEGTDTRGNENVKHYSFDW